MHFDQSTFKETVDENIAADLDLPEEIKTQLWRAIFGRLAE